MSDNWVVGNLQYALSVWNEKLNEIWTLITQTPENFKGSKYKWSNTSNRVSLTCIVLFIWNYKNLFFVCRSKKARAGTKVIYKIYINKNCSNIWIRINVSSI